ncbi:hypothetical protein [Streptomyces sp. XY152]|uniref:hypothetical protein n=1 Tax=Streptomyces sp. XY152 TaxID=1415560 RepID=UPI000A96C3D8|nr:hypothetical protein [Streptomyces sp. XY152]
MLDPSGPAEFFSGADRYGADRARAFPLSHGLSEGDAEQVWTADAPRTTPEILYGPTPGTAVTTAGVATDVPGPRLGGIIRARTGEVIPARTSGGRSSRPSPTASGTARTAPSAR